MKLSISIDSGANARLWSGIMTPIHQGLPPAKFERNPNLIPVQVCSQSGKLPTELCSHDQRGSQVITEYFVPGTQPTETCDAHVKIEVCTSSNMLKSEFCPGNLVEDRVFIKRKTLYDPESKSGNYEAKQLYQQVLEDKVTFSLEELKQIYVGQVEFDESGQIVSVLGVPVASLTFSGLVTSDYPYQVPTKTCTYHTKWHYDQWKDSEENPDNDEDNDGDGDSLDGIIDDSIENNDNGNEDSNSGSSNGNSGTNNGNGNSNDSGSSALDDLIDSVEN